MKPNDKENIALESARKRQVNSSNRFFLFEERMPRRRHNADYFDRLFLLLAFIHIGAPSDMPALAALGRGRICSRILNPLSERVRIGPKFLCQNFVNNRHLRTGLGRLSFGKRATTHDWQANSWKIICADAVPRDIECKALCGSSRPGIGRNIKTG